MPKPKNALAGTVKAGREAMGQTRVELAEAMRKHGWTLNVVVSVENGRRRVDTGELASLAAIQRLPYSAYIEGLTPPSDGTLHWKSHSPSDLAFSAAAAA